MYEKAKEIAKEAHESIGQKRKFTNGPYYKHPLAVAALLEDITDDEDILAAACLHDILEDVTPINKTYDEDFICKNFNSRVSNLVVELTNKYTKDNFQNLNRESRKQLELFRIMTISDDAKLIKKADLHHNSMELPNSEFAKMWLKEKQEIEKQIGCYLDLKKKDLK